MYIMASNGPHCIKKTLDKRNPAQPTSCTSKCAELRYTVNQPLQVTCSRNLIHKRIYYSKLIHFESPGAVVKSIPQVSKRGLTTEHHSSRQKIGSAKYSLIGIQTPHLSHFVESRPGKPPIQNALFCDSRCLARFCILDLADLLHPHISPPCKDPAGPVESLVVSYKGASMRWI